MIKSTLHIGSGLVFICFALSVSATEFDTENPRCKPSQQRQVSNGHIDLNLTFCNRLTLHNGEQVVWTSNYISPYEVAAERWLQVLTAVDGVEHHSLGINVYVVPLADANGMAGPESEIDVNWRLIPTQGSVFIGSHTYEPEFDNIEFRANILHEMGHVFGVGAYSMDYTRHDKQFGKVFLVRDSQAVKQFNQQYSVNYSELPISDDGGHLYDSKWAEDKPRYNQNGQPVPDMTEELMANGAKIGPVTLGLLDDLGYQVDYSKGDRY